MVTIKGPISFGKSQEASGELKEVVGKCLGLRSISKEEAKKNRQAFGLPE